MSNLDFIRKHILDLPEYKPIYPLEVLSSEIGLPVDALIKLDANENPYGPLPLLQEQLSELNTLHIYPDPLCRELRELLSAYHQIPSSNIIVSAGTDELIDLILRVTINPQDGIINCPPTFGMYEFDSNLNQATIYSVSRNDDFSINISEIIEVVKNKKPKLIFIANPNNPDGSVLSKDEIDQLLSLPILVVIDEAYIEFSGSNSYIKEVMNNENLIVLRTFSKWAGLAGLRVGYGVFCERIAEMLLKAKQPYNVTVYSEKAAVLTMKNKSFIDERNEHIIKQRDFLFNELKKIENISPLPSNGNFLLCEIKKYAAIDIKDKLRQKGILVRHFNAGRLSKYIRISVGSESQNKKVIKILKGVLSK